MPISIRSGAVFGEGNARCDGVLNARVPGGQVADEGGPALGLARSIAAADLLPLGTVVSVRLSGCFRRCSQLFPFLGDFGFG